MSLSMHFSHQSFFTSPIAAIVNDYKLLVYLFEQINSLKQKSKFVPVAGCMHCKQVFFFYCFMNLWKYWKCFFLDILHLFSHVLKICLFSWCTYQFNLSIRVSPYIQNLYRLQQKTLIIGRLLRARSYHDYNPATNVLAVSDILQQIQNLNLHLYTRRLITSYIAALDNDAF